jgi:GxxExxY protein
MVDGDLLYKNEVYAIVGAAMEVYNQMGSGFLEAVYEEAMIIESKLRNIPCVTQVHLPVQYKGFTLSREYIADYIGYENVVVEFKCSEKLSAYDEAQLINYLKITGKKVGLLINFGNRTKLEWKRFVF